MQKLWDYAGEVFRVRWVLKQLSRTRGTRSARALTCPTYWRADSPIRELAEEDSACSDGADEQE